MTEKFPFLHCLYLVSTIGVTKMQGLSPNTVEHYEAQLREYRAKLSPDEDKLVVEAKQKMLAAVADAKHRGVQA